MDSRYSYPLAGASQPQLRSPSAPRFRHETADKDVPLRVRPSPASPDPAGEAREGAVSGRPTRHRRRHRRPSRGLRLPRPLPSCAQALRRRGREGLPPLRRLWTWRPGLRELLSPLAASPSWRPVLAILLRPEAFRPFLGRWAPMCEARLLIRSPCSVFYAKTQCRGVTLLDDLAIAHVHVDPAGQARIEAAHGTHDVDALEVVGAVLLEDRHAGHRVLVRARRPEGVGRRPVPRRRRVWMVVCDLAVPDHEVVREDSPDCLVEAASDTLVRHLELLEDLGLAGAHQLEGLLREVDRRRRRVGNEIDPGPIPLDGVGPLGHLPLEVGLGHGGRLGQVDLDAIARGFHVATDIDEPCERCGPEPGYRAAAGIQGEVIACAPIVPARAHHPTVVAAFEVPLLGLGECGLVPRVPLVHRIAQRVARYEGLFVLPVLIVGGAEQDADSQVYVNQVRRDQLSVDDDARRDEHGLAPLVHVAVLVVADVWVVEGTPATEEYAPAPDLFVARKRLVEEVEYVVVHRDGLLDPVHKPHEADQVVREELRRRHSPDTTRVQRRWVDVTPFHKAEHLSGETAHLEGFFVRLPCKRIERAHDVGDGTVAVDVSVGCRRLLSPLHQARVGRADQLLAEVHEHQVILEDAVVEDVLCGLAQVDDPLCQGRRLYAIGHLLRVARTGRMVVAADAADAARDEVGVARVLALHKHAVAAEDRRGTLALHHLAVVEVYLRVDPEVPDDTCDRVPRHLREVPRFRRYFFSDSHLSHPLYARHRGS